MWKCPISRFMEDINKRRLNLNSAQKEFACIWQSKWVGVIVTEIERTQIHLVLIISDVSRGVRRRDILNFLQPWVLPHRWRSPGCCSDLYFVLHSCYTNTFYSKLINNQSLFSWASLLRCFLRYSLAFVKVQSKQSHGIGKPNNVSILRGHTVHKLSNRYSALASSDVRSFRVLSHSERSKQWPKWSSNLSFWNIVSVFLAFFRTTSLIFSFTLRSADNNLKCFLQPSLHVVDNC